MPRQAAILVENNFVKGLNTDSNPLNYPTSTSTETFNCVFSIQGRVSRRAGMALETGYVYNTRTIYSASEAFVEFVWTPVAGDSTLSFLVQQQGSQLLFYNISTQVDSVSPVKFAQEVGLTDPTLNTTTKNPSTYPCSFTQGNGDLFVCNEACEPFYVRYTVSTGVFGAYPITITFRDFEGASSDTTLNSIAGADTIRFGVSSATLATDYPGHYYNLQNQGWYIGDALSQWDTARTDLPGNNDIVSLYRSSATDTFDNARVGSQDPGNAAAPRGHFILDLPGGNRQGAYNTQKGASIAGITLPAVDASYVINTRPTSVTFFTGRVFYAGINIKKYNSSIFFTQIIEYDIQYGRCYQKNDPTNETTFDLLPSDGGIINIPEIGVITKLFSMQGALIIIASNGVWTIGGSNNGPFTANDYTVKKISSIGSISPLSVVDVGGSPVWWGEDGIYGIKYDPNYGNFTVESRSFGVIGTFLDTIPRGNLKYVKGVYDVSNFIISWIYNTTAGAAPYKYNGVLNQNVLNGSYYPWTIKETGPVVRGIVYLRDSQHSANAIVKFPTTITADSTHNYLTYSSIYSTTYKDWSNASLNGGSTYPYASFYTSHFVTGYTIPGQTQMFAQPNYIFVYFEQFLDSSFKVRTIYDFTNTPNSGKYSSSQQLISTAPINDRVVGVRRLKGRGKGRSMQMEYTSVDGQPFTIIGWSTWITFNAAI